MIETINDKLARCEAEAKDTVAGKKLAVKCDIPLVNDLRAFATWLEDKPNIVKKLGNKVFGMYLSTYSAKEDLAILVKEIGACEKEYLDNSLYLRRDFGKTVQLSLSTSREAVCAKKVVGTKTVPSAYYPEHEVDIVEWDCPESVLGALEADND